MKRLGKTEKEVVEFLEKNGMENSYAIQKHIADNYSHWSRCILPSLHRLAKRGMVKHYYWLGDGWYYECGEISGIETQIPEIFKDNDKVTSIWELVKE